MKDKRIKIYLSGGMTGYTEEQFKANFKKAKEHVIKLFSKHYENVCVINPTEKPYNVIDGFDYEDCLRIDMVCVEVCDLIAMLPNWVSSPGANREYKQALRCHNSVYMIDYNDTHLIDKITNPRCLEYTEKSLFD